MLPSDAGRLQYYWIGDLESGTRWSDEMGVKLIPSGAGVLALGSEHVI